MLSVSMSLEEAQAFVLYFNAVHKEDEALASEQSDRVLEVLLTTPVACRCWLVVLRQCHAPKQS